MKPPSTRLLACLGLALCGVALASPPLARAAAPAGEVLLAERFKAGRRLVSDLPGTAAWYCSAPTGVADHKGLLAVSANRHVLAYFRPPHSPVELEPGATLRAEFRFSLVEPVPSNTTLRVALLHSGGAARRVSADNTGLANPLFAGYTGYAALLNLGRATAIGIFQRDDNVTPATGKLINGNDDYAILAGNLGVGAVFAPDTSYTGRLELSRSAEGVRIAFSVAELPGYAAAHTDTVSPYLRFDTFVLFGATSGMGGYKVESADISLLPAAATR